LKRWSIGRFLGQFQHKGGRSFFITLPLGQMDRAWHWTSRFTL
jgi:hypothetical protein